MQRIYGTSNGSLWIFLGIIHLFAIGQVLQKKRGKRVKKQSSFEVVKPKVIGEETVCGTYGLETCSMKNQSIPIGIHVVSLF